MDGYKIEQIELRNLTEQSYAMKESLRALKTNIQFCGDDNKVIMFTSSYPDEGKSTVTMELARSLTDSGKNVLIMDTDMRKSVLVGRTLAKSLSKNEIYGLSHYLSGQRKLNEVLYVTQNPHLYMVFAGPAVPNPTEILEKKYFKELMSFVREKFDYILVDCAPLGAAIDAAVVAKQCDAAVIVVAQGETSSKMIISVKKQLEASGVNILGVVLNKVKTERAHYGKYGYGKYGKYGKYGYGHYGEYGNYGNNKDESMISDVTESKAQ